MYAEFFMILYSVDRSENATGLTERNIWYEVEVVHVPQFRDML